MKQIAAANHLQVGARLGLESDDCRDDIAVEQGRVVPVERRQRARGNMLLRSMDIDGSGVFIANLASPGLVAETGNFRKTVEAVQYLDTCLGGIIKKVRQLNGLAVITA